MDNLIGTTERRGSMYSSADVRLW